MLRRPARAGRRARQPPRPATARARRPTARPAASHALTACSTRSAAGRAGAGHPRRLPVGRRADPQAAGHWQAAAPDRRRRATARLLVVAAFRSEEVPAGHPLRAIERAAPGGPAAAAAAGRAAGWPSRWPGRCPTEAVAVRRPPRPTAARSWPRRCCGAWSSPGRWCDDAAGWRGRPPAHGRRAIVPAGGGVPGPPPRAAARRRAGLLSVGAVLGKEFDLDLAGRSWPVQAPARRRLALDEARRRHIVWVDGRRRPLRLRPRQAPGGAARPARARTSGRRCTAGRPSCASRQATASGSSSSPTTSTPPATRARPALRPARPPTGPGPSTRWTSPSSTTGSPTAAARPTPPATRAAQVAEGLGDVLILRGRYDEAAAAVRAGPQPGRRRSRRARALDGKLGDLAFKRGDMAQPPAGARAGAAPARRPGAARPAAACSCDAVREVLVQALHTLLPRLFLGRRQPGTARAAEEFLAIRLYSRLAYVYWFAPGQGRLRLGPPAGDEPGRALPADARAGPGLLRARPGHDDAALVRPGHRLRRAVAGHPHGPWATSGARASRCTSTASCSTRPPASSRCIDNCREAVRLLERTGDRWEVNTATWHIAFATTAWASCGPPRDMARTPVRRGHRHRRRPGHGDQPGRVGQGQRRPGARAS